MAEKIHTMTGGAVIEPRPGSALHAAWLRTWMTFTSLQHRGDCRQGNKLQGDEGKSVVMQLCGEVWWNQAHGNELVLAGGRLQTMIRGGGWNNGIWRV